MARIAAPTPLWLLLAVLLGGCQPGADGAIPGAATTGPLAARERAPRYRLLLQRSEPLPGWLRDEVQAAGGRLLAYLAPLGLVYLEGASPELPRRLAALPGVQAVLPEVAYALPGGSRPAVAAPLSAGAGGGGEAPDALYRTQQWSIRRVGAPRAWRLTRGSRGAPVAVIDTGVAWNHPDLAPNVLYAGCYTRASLARTGPCNPYPGLHYHGTHVAGVVAAALDHGAAVGVAPEAGILAYNVYEMAQVGKGQTMVTYETSVFAAMVDAVRRGARVINLSLGDELTWLQPHQARALRAAWTRAVEHVEQQGALVVASLGNRGLALRGLRTVVPGGLPSVVGVGASVIRPAPRFPQRGHRDERAFYSNYGEGLDLLAPGGDCGWVGGCSGSGAPLNAQQFLVLSTVVTLKLYSDPPCAQTADCPVSYGHEAGTSMAAPHVAGVAALLAAQNPRLGPGGLRALLLRTAQPLGPPAQTGRGMVDAAAAVSW